MYIKTWWEAMKRIELGFFFFFSRDAQWQDTRQWAWTGTQEMYISCVKWCTSVHQETHFYCEDCWAIGWIAQTICRVSSPGDILNGPVLYAQSELALAEDLKINAIDPLQPHWFWECVTTTVKTDYWRKHSILLLLLLSSSFVMCIVLFIYIFYFR